MSSPEEDNRDAGDAAPARRISATRLVVALVAVLVGAVAAGGVLFARGGFSDSAKLGDTVIGEGSSYTETDFTRSQAGDCLTWGDGAAGTPSKVDCADQHRFEVAGTVDTAQFPGSEFGPTAPWPGPERFAAIRDEQCGVIVDRYLGGGLDPQGRLAVGLMYPPKAQWERGARVLRCGIEQPGPNGAQELFAGRAADTDQSFAWPDGTCIGFDDATRKPTGEPVDCAEPHAFQTTGVVDLSQRFGSRDSGKPWPGVAAQNDYLKTICPNQTNRFFGGAKKFDNTTLNVQWSVISEVSWMTGSRRVVCYVAVPDRGGFAKLVGDARQQVLVNGKLPVPPAQGPPGRALPTPVPLPPGYSPNGQEVPAPSGG
ncbi:septum formation family protein [Gordonia sp. (in: high G+C Gram-positive bacteria)]|uniref:septum formation family protein n=1 Tax=Gordonia sp. (in: high G+C Gram-positive bacteria) TaxID=84139 RepID=UPI0026318218|nr:septum formation family protein [Gordonia sp. (in: high G+C Gram-positive bacteria)]